MTDAIHPSPRERRLASLVLEPRVFINDPRDEMRRIDSVYGLIQLLRTCDPLDSVLEVGSFRGVSTETLLLFASQVIAVDPWDGLDDVFQSFLARTRPYSHLEIIRGRSVDVAADFADGSFDLVYIDGAHDPASIRADITAWRPKVKPGKWLAGHDYSPLIASGSVIHAVDELLGAPLRVFEDSSWLVRLDG